MIGAFSRFLTIAFAGSCLIPVVIIVVSLGERDIAVPLGKTLLALTVVGIATFLFRRMLRALHAAIDSDAQEQAKSLDTLHPRYVGLAVAGSAALSLLVELAVIRWQGTVFEFFAFYKNFGLLACFAGLGLGYALAARDRLPLLLTIPLLAWQFALLIGLRHGLQPEQLKTLIAIPVIEQLNMGVLGVRTLMQGFAVYFFLSVVFLLTALAFIPIGQLCGRLMARRPQLDAYALNLAGSLGGVLLMFLISALWTPPILWYVPAFAGILLLSTPRLRTLVPGVIAALVAVMILAWPVGSSWQRIYSPYQLLEMGFSTRGFMELRAAGHYYQRVFDLSSSDVEVDQELRRIRAYYDFPYLVRPRPAEVAVVGSGTGNDVSAAIRAGAGRVDAIEIDPAILMAGRRNHPEHPYQNPNVRTFLDDARSFLRTTDRDYDLIVYGLLDSHTLLSHASSVRLDSFVYTVEAFREARARLKPGGLLVVSFSVMKDAIGWKMVKMLRQAFDGAAPVSIRAGYDGAVVFLQSKEGDFELPAGLLEETGFQKYSLQTARGTTRVDASTDDWPFFYMPRRIYPVSYLVMLGMVVLGAVALTGNFIGERPRFSDLSFFLLGAGFMLIETKAITELGLTFGSTWHVIGIAISGILLMAFLANTAVKRLNLRRPWIAYALLLLCLAAGWWVKRSGGFPSTPAGRVATIALLTSPMFFSGIVFSTMLSVRGAVAGAMAANLLGSMLGGLLEYNSMAFGFQSLYLIAMALYLLAFVSSQRGLPLR